MQKPELFGVLPDTTDRWPKTLFPPGRHSNAMLLAQTERSADERVVRRNTARARAGLRGHRAAVGPA